MRKKFNLRNILYYIVKYHVILGVVFLGDKYIIKSPYSVSRAVAIVIAVAMIDVVRYIIKSFKN
jgi:hypothetical protein